MSYEQRRELRPVQRVAHRALRRHYDLQRILTSLSTHFINLPAEEIGRGIDEALARIGEFAHVDRSYVFLIDEANGRMSNTHEWAHAATTPEIANLQNVPLSDFPWSLERILRGEIVHVPRVSELPDDAPDKARFLAENIQSLLAVPMIVRDRVIGFFGFDSVRAERRWTKDTISLLRIAASIFANVIERQRNETVLHDEQRFIQNILDTTASLILVLTPGGQCIRANPAFVELTGLTAEELVGDGWKRVVPEDSRSAAREALRRASSGELARFEVPILARNGELRAVLWVGRVVRNGAGVPEYVVVTGVDLTEVKVLREQVDQAQRMDSLGRVAATIAHEVNNVLMAILPSAQVIKRFPDRREEVLRAAERIQDAVKRGERITLEVTRFARPTEPMFQEIRVFDWTMKLVEESREMVETRAGVEIDVRMACDPCDAVVRADPTQLHQVLSNLLLNAFDALPNGGRVTIAVEEIASHERLVVVDPMPSRWVHWMVCDTGAGISPAVLERIFEPLFTTKKRGTGLGLAVAHQIIRAHGGVLSVETAVGAGTTFHLFLRAV